MKVKSVKIALGNETREFIVGRLFDGQYKITEIEEDGLGWLIKTEIDGNQVIVAEVISNAAIVAYEV